jgi:ceramide glucosyltransferase
LLVSFPLPLAVLAALYWPFAGLALAAGALAVRLFAAASVDRITGTRAAPRWVLPLRDSFGFAVYLASFCARSVDWRGAHLRIGQHGQIVTAPEIRP